MHSKLINRVFWCEDYSEVSLSEPLNVFFPDGLNLIMFCQLFLLQPVFWWLDAQLASPPRNCPCLGSAWWCRNPPGRASAGPGPKPVGSASPPLWLWAILTVVAGTPLLAIVKWYLCQTLLKKLKILFLMSINNFKGKFLGGFQSLCQIPRLGNLLWILELSYCGS